MKTMQPVRTGQCCHMEGNFTFSKESYFWKEKYKMGMLESLIYICLSTVCVVQCCQVEGNFSIWRGFCFLRGKRNWKPSKYWNLSKLILYYFSERLYCSISLKAKFVKPLWNFYCCIKQNVHKLYFTRQNERNSCHHPVSLSLHSKESKTTIARYIPVFRSLYCVCENGPTSGLVGSHLVVIELNVLRQRDVVVLFSFTCENGKRRGVWKRQRQFRDRYMLCLLQRRTRIRMVHNRRGVFVITKGRVSLSERVSGC